ncbi:histidine kinase [Tsukamurella sp. NPDC003166]|uniref:sensor histidine kinase n=1 Tax=Tsukamurella sp. NPDC003166 TaxID=3154444 RepID=UPI00339E43FA
MSRSAWLNTAAAMPLHAAVVTVVVAPWVSLPAELPVVTVALLSVPVVAPVIASPVLTRVHRSRLARVGVVIPPSRDERVWRSAARVRQLAHHVVVGPLLLLALLAVIVGWLLVVVGGTSLLWMWVRPAGGLPHTVWEACAWTVAAAAGGALLWWATPLLPVVDARCAAVLLGPGSGERLSRRVEDLTESRAGVVEAADAERRRLERDLHDGVQQRLVSLAVNLGVARATLADLSEPARVVLDDAHDQAKLAIAELGHLVRGLHPPVLEDRGLDAALSGLAGTAAIPVDLTVRLPYRPTPAVEAVAYFVVSETLTNVIKHAHATRAGVVVDGGPKAIVVTVEDDGVGGADPSRGTGLAGLARRTASVDGHLRVTSPPGGPTTVRAELPCAR